jgi:hypothetical protein
MYFLYRKPILTICENGACSTTQVLHIWIGSEINKENNAEKIKTQVVKK